MKVYRNPLAYLTHPVELATLAFVVLSQSRGAQGTSRGVQSPAGTPALAPGKSAPTPGPAQDGYCVVDRQVNANWVDACQTFKVRPGPLSSVWPYAGPRHIISYGTSEMPPCELGSVTATQPNSQTDPPLPTEAVYPVKRHDLLNSDGFEFDNKCNALTTNVAAGCADPVDMC